MSFDSNSKADTKANSPECRRRLPCASVAALMVVAALPASALAGFSKGGPFRDGGYGARAGALGGAVVAFGGDEAAVYWNPACLADLEGPRLGFSYVDLVQGAGAHHSQAAYARALSLRLDPQTGESLIVHSAGAMFTNTSVDLFGGIGYSESGLRLAYSYSPDYFFSFGAALSLLVTRSDLNEFDSRGSSVDFGMRMKLLEELYFGFTARNAASLIMYGDGHDEELQRSYTLAFALRDVKGARIEAATVMAYGGLARSTLGVEYSFLSKRLRLRAAITSIVAGEDRVVPHFGLGMVARRLILDYNADLDSEKAFGGIHRFSLGIMLD